MFHGKILPTLLRYFRVLGKSKDSLGHLSLMFKAPPPPRHRPASPPLLQGHCSLVHTVLILDRHQSDVLHAAH